MHLFTFHLYIEVIRGAEKKVQRPSPMWYDTMRHRSLVGQINTAREVMLVAVGGTYKLFLPKCHVR